MRWMMLWSISVAIPWPEEQCPYGCATPKPQQYPINMALYMVDGAGGQGAVGSVAAGGGVAEGACCPTGGGDCCASESEVRSAIACRPRAYASGAGSAGFLHIVGSNPRGEYFRGQAPGATAVYKGYGLPLETEVGLSLLRMPYDPAMITPL